MATTDKKVAVLTNTQEYELTRAKSTSTPYKMLKRVANDLSWQKLNGRSVLPITTDVHAASDFHRKQPDETLQEYIYNFTDLKKAVDPEPANITNSHNLFIH